MVIQSEELVASPMVSVVIPSFNRSGTVGETIHSILNQKCNFPIEIVIGDDCSTDNAREVLMEFQQKYPEIIVLLFHETNVGLAANWASCVKLCRGKYLANCDNDDYWHHPDKLQMQVDYLENHPNCGVVHSNFRTLNRATGKLVEVDVSNFKYDNSLQKSIFNGKFKFCNATMMYRLELLNKYVNLDDYIHQHFTLQDWGTWVVLAKYTDFYCLPVSTATLCLETESVTRPKGYLEMEQRLLKEKELYKYLCNLFPDDLPYVERNYDIYINKVLLNIAYTKRDFKSAKGYGSKLLLFGLSGVKVRFSQYLLLFYLFYFTKNLRRLF